MFALAINGSPRKEGNTNRLLQAVLEPLKENKWDTETVQIGGQTLRGCVGCRRCFTTKDNQCIFKNDIFNEVMGRMVEADAIIIGSPTYFSSMTAETKALIDRAGYVAGANGQLFKGKIGAAVSAVRRAGAVHVVEGIHRMYLIRHMVILGSTYWNHGVGWAEGEVEKDEEGFRNMKDLGQTIALAAPALKPLRERWPG